jgi:hypothetical protein
MHIALGFVIAAPAFVLAGESVRHVIARMLDTPTAAVTSRRETREFART